MTDTLISIIFAFAHGIFIVLCYSWSMRNAREGRMELSTLLMFGCILNILAFMSILILNIPN